MPLYTRRGSEAAVNSTFARSQAQAEVSRLDDGNYVTVWTDADFTTTAGRHFRAQISRPDGTPVGSEITLFSGSFVSNPNVAGLSGGGFAMTWMSSSSIRVQIFDGNGVATGTAFTATPPSGASSVTRPEIASLDGGGFVVTWQDSRTTGSDISGSGIRARQYDANGVAVGGEVLVNTATAGNQADQSVSALAGGGYIVTWTDRGASGSGAPWLIKAQIFATNGTRTGGEFIINAETTGLSSVESSVTALADGGFAVAWYESVFAGGSGHRIRMFDASGTAVGSIISFESGFTGTQTGPVIAALSDGSLAVAWVANSAPLSDGSGRAVFVQVYGADGVADGPAMLVNSQTNGDQIDPAIVALSDGRFAVTWTDMNGSGADDDEVRTQMFGPTPQLEITSDGGGDLAALSIFENEFSTTTVTASGAGVSYAIVGGADAALFSIDAASGALSFIGVPNFEAPGDAGGDNVYDVIVQASSGGASDTQTLAITVINSDETPAIGSNGGGPSGTASLLEGQVFVATVAATDPESAAITYSIAGGADAALFALDSTTGVLNFIAAPDFETGGDNLYDIVVSASDGFTSDTQSLSITVGNVNEGVLITTGSGFVVPEDGTEVASVTATDADGDAITYSIVGGADAALFSIDAVTGALSFIAAPNFEAPGDAGADNVYDVTVLASDGTLSDSRTLAVTVGNINDIAPQIGFWQSDEIVIALPEGNAGLVDIDASDAEGDAITYALAGTDANLFTIDAATGAVSFVATPDFEAPGSSGGSNTYLLSVIASDGLLSDTVAITVHIGNINEAISITSFGGAESGAISISENGTAIATITASDIDGDAPVFSIFGGADAARFAIDVVTGALSFLAAANFEAPVDANGDNVYEVAVRVSDGTLSDTQALFVSILNANEVPFIVSGGGGPFASFSVAENNTAITDIAASDPDGTVPSYAIVGGADAARFTINALTGALAFVVAPNFEAPADANANNIYEVIVAAGDGSLSAPQTVFVTVDNVNEAVVITSSGGGAGASVTVNENILAVSTVAATDPEGAARSYAIIGGADAARFTINPTTGALGFASAPNHESPTDAGANNVYDVIVRASDGVTADTQAIAVTVANVRDGQTINGTNAANTIVGSSAEDTINGQGGNDTITGGLGVDWLTGGTGADRFVFNTIADSHVSAPDIIHDFSRSQGDRISVNPIDANINASGNQNFAFIGSAAFSNIAGQLRYEHSNGNTFVMGDINGDGVADFMIQVNGTIPLTSVDFLL